MDSSLRPPRGFEDIFGERAEKFRRVVETCTRILRSHSFEEIILPVVEFADLFERSIGEVTDIVQKEMFVFPDRKGRLLALRPEGTAGAVRAFIKARMWTSRPYGKLYYWGPMFRYERPQAGRYRQFHQVGAEVFGSDSPLADAEIIGIVHRILSELSVDFRLEINSIGCKNCRPSYRKELLGFLGDKIEDLCDYCRRRMERNPLRVLDCKVESCRTAVADAPRTLDYLCDGCRAHFDKLRELLDSYGIPYSVSPNLVRGLDYYTRTVFEAVSPSTGSAIVAGGRYDYLVEELGGPPTPALGFAVGVERVMLELGEEVVRGVAKKVLVVPFGDVGGYALKVADRLRDEGWVVELSLRRGGLKKQLEFANRIGVGWVAIVGEDEVAKGGYILKDMESGEQRFVALKS